MGLQAPPAVASPRVVLNLTDGYARGGAVSVQRGLALAENKAAGLVISDEWQHTRAAFVEWYMYTAANVTVKGSNATLTLDGVSLALRVTAPAAAHVTMVAEDTQLAFPDVSTMSYLGGAARPIHRVKITVPASAGRLVVQLGEATTQGECTAPLARWLDPAMASHVC